MENEAPEKIYIGDFGTAGLSHDWHLEHSYEGDIEYTRTDAFIEKACNGIDHLLSGYIIRNFHFGDSYDIDRLIEDFRNYMKGE